jgi:hypothetical protein
MGERAYGAENLTGALEPQDTGLSTFSFSQVFFSKPGKIKRHTKVSWLMGRTKNPVPRRPSRTDDFSRSPVAVNGGFIPNHSYGLVGDS